MVDSAARLALGARWHSLGALVGIPTRALVEAQQGRVRVSPSRGATVGLLLRGIRQDRVVISLSTLEMLVVALARLARRGRLGLDSSTRALSTSVRVDFGSGTRRRRPRT